MSAVTNGTVCVCVCVGCCWYCEYCEYLTVWAAVPACWASGALLHSLTTSVFTECTRSQNVKHLKN